MHHPARETEHFLRRLNRRRFVAESLGFAALATAPFLISEPLRGAITKKFRAAVIGHTGRGDYGHNLETIFSERANVEVVALADPDADGRARVATKIGARRHYADYQKMLVEERPDLVCVAPRWTGQHHAMALAALRAGAHVFMEKPITRTLAEADELLSIANKANLKVAVAHQMRLAPNIVFLKQRMDAGFIGDLLDIRAHGKQDHRAGGEDLVVLGVHLFDLMRLFAGGPQWCTARVLQDGRDITLKDARAATEDIGLVAGNEIFAQFAFPKGINATFTSRRQNQPAAGPWGMELIGTRGAVKILADICPRIYARNSSDWSAAGNITQWQPIEGDPTSTWIPAEKSVNRANQRVVDDWLDAIEANREPICSGEAGMKALEMAMVVFEAGLTGNRVKLPLVNRRPSLSKAD